jgi:double-stranded uracil-DNA glycosylase
MVTHTFDPIYDKESRFLILGTMPSVRSRMEGFYYMHPKNRFWRMISEIYGEPFPESRMSKISLLQKHGAALWDVLKSCDIDGSSDSSIRDPVPNDIMGVIRKSNIRTVFANGHKAAGLYKTLCQKDTGITAICLPSTSPANNRYYSYEKLILEWSRILSC